MPLVTRPTLRPYQADLATRVHDAWTRRLTPLAVLPTGAGKTVTFAHIIAGHQGSVLVIAHRRELIGQISFALSLEGVNHQIVAPQPTIRQIIRFQEQRLGRSAYSTTARATVCSIDSFAHASQAYLDSVSLWVLDEAHHLLRANKWGRAIARLPSRALGLGVTATPIRADGRGLGRHADGFFDTIIEGPSHTDLVAGGFLCPYRLFAPETRGLDLASVRTNSTGDYEPKQLRAVVHRSTIVGDVVEHYRRHAAGKRGVTFAVGVTAAQDLADAFCAAGVPAKMVHAGTPAAERQAAIDALEHGQILQIVNVDLFGEGFDLPAIDFIAMARPTKSYALYAQQFGRALRPSPGKTHATILDHVRNVDEHRGPPDIPRTWSLDARERRKRGEVFFSPYRACTACTGVYEKTAASCPYCFFVAEPTDRSTPQAVAGDLTLLDDAALAELYGRVALVDRTVAEVRDDAAARNVPEIGQRAAINRHRRLQDGQARLRHTLSWWAGVQRHAGLDDAASMRLFYVTFGVDVLTARSLKPDEADALRERIDAALPEEIRHAART